MADQREQVPAADVIDELLREIARLNGELATARAVIRLREARIDALSAGQEG